MNNLACIITGDIIGSRKKDPAIWLDVLKDALSILGDTPQNWEIYRGDMFQIEVVPESALKAVIHIKLCIKQATGLDVRMAIGIGDVSYRSKRLPESNGTAFIHSGSCFDGLKRNRLAIKTPWQDYDEYWNLILSLASLTMDHWPRMTALIMKTYLDHPDANQSKIAEILNKSQSTISAALNRAGYEEIMSMQKTFKNSILQKKETR